MDIIVIGAGYGGITAALRLGRLFRRQADCRVHLIDRNPYHTLKTQLHEAAVRKRSVAIPIRDIIKHRPILFHQGLVTAIDLNTRQVHIEGVTLPFDFLVFALGSQANFYGIPGLKEFSFPLQTLDDAERIYRHLKALCESATQEHVLEKRRDRLRFVIGGGGLSGVEFAAELKDHAALCAQNSDIAESDDIEVIIVEGTGRILPAMAEDVVTRIEQRLRTKGIKVLTDTLITSLTPDTVILSTGQRIKTETLIWTGGIMVSTLASECGLKVGAMGRIMVDEFLSAHDYPFVYAIGDNALATNPETGRPVPTAAQFALQQGRLVAENIHALATGGEKKAYRPKVLGEIVSLGRHLAVGWMALPLFKKITFFGFLASLLKSAAEEKHILLLRKESRNWVREGEG